MKIIKAIDKFFYGTFNLAMFPSEVLNTKKKRIWFIFLSPLWLIYAFLFFISLLAFAVLLSPAFAIWAIWDKCKEWVASIKEWINKAPEG